MIQHKQNSVQWVHWYPMSNSPRKNGSINGKNDETPAAGSPCWKLEGRKAKVHSAPAFCMRADTAVHHFTLLSREMWECRKNNSANGTAFCVIFVGVEVHKGYGWASFLLPDHVQRTDSVVSHTAQFLHAIEGPQLLVHVASESQ